MKIFVDANVFVALINNELHYAKECAAVLSISKFGKHQLYTSVVTWAICTYMAQKKWKPAKAKIFLKNLFEEVQIVASKKEHITLALENKKVNDLDDGLNYYAAQEIKADCITTYNLKDYNFSETPVNSPIDTLNLIYRK